MRADWLCGEGRGSNGFTFLRLALAILVIFGHVYPLGGYGPDPLFAMTNGILHFGDFPVAIFFSISGFLIAQSLFDSSPLRYLWKRFLRIFPGFWLGLCMSAFVFAPLLYYYQLHSLKNYFSFVPGGPISYVLSNFFLDIRQWNIWHLFAKNPWGYAFNGTFWTLYYEFACYIMLLVLGFSRNKYAKAIILAAFLAFWITMVLDPVAGRLLFSYRAIGRIDIFTTCFLAGSAAFAFKQYIPLKTSLFLLSLVLTAVSLKMNYFECIFPPCLTYAALWLAAKLPSIDRYGDYSYGMYIYGYPTQQLLAYFGLHHYPKLLFFALSLVAAFPLAYLSWKLVEKPVLIFKRLRLTLSMERP